MNKIYRSGNYIIVERDGNLYEYPVSRTIYNYANADSSYIITEQLGGGQITILAADIPTWFDESGTIAYSEATFVSFLRENTANFSKPVTLSFEELTDVPGYAGNGGDLVSVNNTEDGIEYINKDSVIYDSGWKTIPIFNGSYGLANTGSAAARPKVRVINRTLHIQGTYILPLATTTGGGSLNGNQASYVSSFLPTIYQGAGDGYEVRVFNDIRTRSPILPTALRPDQNIQDNGVFLDRTINIGGRAKMGTFVPIMLFTTDGRLYFITLEARERNGLTGTGFQKSSFERVKISKFESGDSLMNFNNFSNSFDGTGLIDKRVLTDSGSNWSFNFDGSKGGDLGGMQLRFTTSYNLNKAFTIDQIKTAFDAL